MPRPSPEDHQGTPETLGYSEALKEELKPLLMKEFAKSTSKDTLAWVDWPRVISTCSISSKDISSHEALGDLSTVWYQGSTGASSSWREQGARRLRVSEVHRAPGVNPPEEETIFLNEEVRERGMERARRHPTPSPHLHLFPAYRTAAGELILLDGNHRTVALYRSFGESSVTLTVIEPLSGQDDPFLLPDLLHELPPMAPSEWSKRVKALEERFAQGPILP